MLERTFAHLHVHSEFSVLDGANKMDALVKRVKALGMTACALTDHGTLYGLIEFYKAAKKEGIKPILGCEAYVTQDPDDSEKRTRDNKHMVLLVQNEQGLKNLIWMINRANKHNFYYKPRIWKGHFAERSEGLIATSACLAGVVARNRRVNAASEIVVPGAFHNPNTQKWTDPQGTGREWLEELVGYFGNRFYLEIQDNPMWEQKAWNKFAIEYGDKNDIPLVITADAHYLREDSEETHELIIAQQLKMTLEEYRNQGGMKYQGKYFIREPRDMHNVVTALNAPEAYYNTMEIADMCNVELTLGKTENPLFDYKNEDDYSDFLQWKDRRKIEPGICSVTDDGT